MTFLTVTRTAVLGLALGIAAAAPALAEPHADTQNFLTAPGIGVVANIGNNEARDVPLFATGEQPRPLWVYDVDKGTHVLREEDRDRTRAVQLAGPKIDFGLDIL